MQGAPTPSQPSAPSRSHISSVLRSEATAAHASRHIRQQENRSSPTKPASTNRFFAGLNWLADAADKAVVGALWEEPKPKQEEEKQKRGRERAKRDDKTSDRPAARQAQEDERSDRPADAKSESTSPSKPISTSPISTPARYPQTPISTPARYPQTPEMPGDRAAATPALFPSHGSPLKARQPNHQDDQYVPQDDKAVPRYECLDIDNSQPLTLEPAPRGVSVSRASATEAESHLPLYTDNMTFGHPVNRVPTVDVAQYNNNFSMKAQFPCRLKPSPRFARATGFPMGAAGDTAVDIGLIEGEDFEDAPLPQRTQINTTPSSVHPTPRVGAFQTGSEPIRAPKPVFSEDELARLLEEMSEEMEEMAQPSGPGVAVHAPAPQDVEATEEIEAKAQMEDEVSRETTASATTTSSKETSSSILSKASELQRTADAAPTSAASPQVAADEETSSSTLSNALELQTTADAPSTSTPTPPVAAGEETSSSISPEALKLQRSADEAPHSTPTPEVAAEHALGEAESRAASANTGDATSLQQRLARSAAVLATNEESDEDGEAAPALPAEQVSGSAPASESKTDNGTLVKSETQPASASGNDVVAKASLESETQPAAASGSVEGAKTSASTEEATETNGLSSPAKGKQDWRYFAQKKLQGQEQKSSVAASSGPQKGGESLTGGSSQVKELKALWGARAAGIATNQTSTEEAI